MIAINQYYSNILSENKTPSYILSESIFQRFSNALNMRAACLWNIFQHFQKSFMLERL